MFNLFRALSKILDNKAIDSENSLPSSLGSLDSALSPTTFFLSLDSSLNYTSKVGICLMSSSSVIIFKSFASLIVVALYVIIDQKWHFTHLIFLF